MLQAAKLGLRGINIELENIETFDMPWWRRFWLYRHGFTSSRGEFYDISRDNVDEYLNDIQHQKMYMKQFDVNEKVVTSDKVIFHLVFSRTHPSHVPELLAIYRPDRGVCRVPGNDLESVSDVVDELEHDAGKLILKHRSGYSGIDTHVLGHDGESLTYDGERITEDELSNRLRSQPVSIVTEFVQQAAYAQDIYPGSANTIKMLTIVDPETNEPFVANAYHRIGTENSGPVDNWAEGGLCAHVDMDTGELGQATIKRDGFSEEITHHPDTGTEITGKQIPNWSEVLDGVMEIAEEYKGLLTYIAWDLVVTGDDDSFKIIEANSATDVTCFQIQKPLLANDRVRRFYEHHGVL